MTPQTLLFSSLREEDLRNMISDVIKFEIKQELQFAFANSTQKNDLLTRKETASILGISLPTLHDWTLNGKIPAYRIGSRIRFKRLEVEKSLTLINAKGGVSC